MKKKLKSIIALASVLSAALVSSIFVQAEDLDNAVGISSSISPITVDGNIIDNAKYIPGTTIMIPIRAIAEKLGYEVIWDGEHHSVALAKMPQYITFQIGIDGYSFAKSAPMPLGISPVIVDNTTYVPLSLITDIMNLKVEVDNDTLNIISEQSTIEENEKEFEKNEEAAQDMAEGKIISVDEQNSQILINDSIRGEVMLVIGDMSIIRDENGNALDLSQLKEGTELTIEYSPAMTMSIPPINNPIKVIVH